jgi:glycine betaine catabolism B
MQVIFDHSEDITSHIKTFWFKPEPHIRYVAGQFIELFLPHPDHDERGIKRWFTLSSSPTDPLVSITTKIADKPSTFKQQLLALKPGAQVHMSETMGDFVLPKDRKAPLVFIAGGIGVTPIHSMVKYLADMGEQRTTHLLYNARNYEEIAFKELFDHTLTKSEYIADRKLTVAEAIAVIEKYQNPLVYISGPEEMVEVFVAAFNAQGIPPSRVVTDYFPGYAGQI